MEALFAIFFVILFCSVLVWFFLCHRLFKILATRHQQTYEAMGKPTLFMNNSVSNNLSFLKFLFKKEWKALNDEHLAKLCSSMLIFSIAYLILFLTLFVVVLFGFEY